MNPRHFIFLLVLLLSGSLAYSQVPVSFLTERSYNRIAPPKAQKQESPRSRSLDLLFKSNALIVNQLRQDSVQSLLRILSRTGISTDSSKKIATDSAKAWNRKIDSVSRSIKPKIDSITGQNDVQGSIDQQISDIKAYRNSEILVVQKDYADYIRTLADNKTLTADTMKTLMDEKDLEEQEKLDEIKQSAANRIHALKIVKSYSRLEPLIFPAYYSNQARLFFTEKDSVASRFFANNSLSYNSSLQKLSFYNETYYDFFGPLRFGVGFALTSVSNQPDSLKTKDDAAQKIISGGGNLNASISFPVWQCSADKMMIKSKAFLSYKAGVDIPKDSASSSTYGLVNDIGLNVNFYSIGILRKIQLFETTRISYLFGNRNFADRLGLNDFWMAQNSFGIAVKDKFRMRIDYYLGLGNSSNFVKENFPITISFDIVNPF